MQTNNLFLHILRRNQISLDHFVNNFIKNIFKQQRKTIKNCDFFSSYCEIKFEREYNYFTPTVHVL